jgi:hypothetical protein
MRFSDAGLHQRQAKAVYPQHPSPPWLTEDATRDRSNRLLGVNCIGRSQKKVPSRSVRSNEILAACNRPVKGTVFR